MKSSASQSRWRGRSGVPGPQPSSSSFQVVLVWLLPVDMKSVSSASVPTVSVEADVCMLPLAKRIEAVEKADVVGADE